MSTSIPKSKLDHFLKQARKIIAKEGGMSAGAMSKIQEAGSRHGLTNTQIIIAVGQLDKPAGSESKENVYRKLVETEIKKEAVLSPRLKHKLLACARLQLAITTEDAQQMIDEVVTEHNLPVSNAAEARAQLDTQIKQACQFGEPSWDGMLSLYSTAHHIGLDRKHVENRISEMFFESAEKNKKFWLYSAFIAVPLLLIGIGAGIWAMTAGSRTPMLDPDDKIVKASKTKTPVAPPKKNGDPGAPSEKWWANIDGFDSAFAQLKTLFPKEETLFKDLAAPKSVDRLTAHQRVLLKVSEFYENKEARPHLTELLAGSFAGEPSLDNSKQIEDWLVSQFPKHSDKIINENAANFEQRLWFAKVTVTAIKHPQVSPERQTSLCNGLQQQMDETIEPSNDKKTLLDHVSATMCNRLFKNVLVTSQDDPNLALRLSDDLSKVSAPFLPEKTRRDGEADLLVAVLSQPNVDPKLVKPRLSSHFPTFNTEMKKAVLTAYRSAPKELGAAIEPILTKVVDANIEPNMTQAEKADAMISVLDYKSLFRDIATARAKAVAAQPDKLLPILQETLNLAHASTVGCALAHPATGHAELNALVKKSPVLGKPKKVAEEPKKDEGEVVDPIPPPVPAAPPVISGALTVGDPFDRIRRRSRADIHPYPMVGGISYVISMTGTFDTYLRLEDPLGRHIMSNDNGGPGLNSRILFRAPRTGTYRIVATAYSARHMGPYTITIAKRGFGVLPPPQLVPVPGAPIPGMFGGIMKPQKVPIEQLLPHLQQLVWRDNSPDRRASAFGQIASHSKGNLNPAIARILAEYLLEYKDLKEFKSKVQSLKSSDLKDSRDLKLAMVDYIDRKKKLVPNKVEDVFSAMLGKDVEFADRNNWESEARTFMLQHVIENIEVQAPADETAKMLREQYVKQGLAMGMDKAAFSETSTPSETLEKLIDHLSSQLRKNSISVEQKKLLDEVHEQTLVADAAAGNDLTKTVLLQRQWLRLLSVYVTQRRPERAESASNVQQQVEAVDQKATHILTQLRDGELHILRLWQLLHQTKS